MAVSRFESSLNPHQRVGLATIKCAVLWRAVNGTPATKRTLGTIREEKGISSGFRVSVSLQYDLSY